MVGSESYTGPGLKLVTLQLVATLSYISAPFTFLIKVFLLINTMSEIANPVVHFIL